MKARAWLVVFRKEVRDGLRDRRSLFSALTFCWLGPLLVGVLWKQPTALWKALPTFRGDCSEKTFALRVAHNRCLTHVWRRGKSRESEGELPEIPDPRKSPEALAIDSRRRETLLAAIRALPVNYRQVITLALEDLAPAEIAAVLGVTENNIAVRLNRARKALRTILEEKPLEERL